ncbi:MAG: hypothetical protein U1B83_07175, partial [Candidatus Cloacimonadaceae bacterium]|nr:hypothetical protein [Candidatus Cloacimonadaceae bacterium]
VTSCTAITGGTITNSGWDLILISGVCWGTNPNPDITGEHTIQNVVQGSFTEQLTGLQSDTTYFVRAYATNAAGTTYGNELSFTTALGTLESPQNLTIRRLGNSVFLTWNAVPNALSYLIYRSVDPFAENWGLPAARILATSWIDSSAPGMYFYRVSASTEPAE